MDSLSNNTKYQVVIAGGGMVGVTLALAFAKYLPHWRIAVVDRFMPRTDNDSSLVSSTSFDGRSTVLSEGSRRILSALDVWEDVEPYAAPITHIHVSERKAFGSVLLSAEERGWSAMGYVIENVQFGRSLFRALQKQASIDFIGAANVVAIKYFAEHSEVVVEKNHAQTQLTAELVIVADGVGSSLRESLGITAQTHDYSQVGLIANVGFSKPHEGYAYERFTDWGPMALLPLLNAQNMNRAALIWTMDKARADEFMTVSDEVFLSTLQQRFGYRQGRFLKVGERHRYALRLEFSDEQVRHRLVILGNAAHTLHPVAGQGFNLSLRDVMTLVDTLADAQNGGRDIGDLSVLEKYLQRRRADQQNTINFSHHLTSLFAKDNVFFEKGRRLGLIGLDNCSGLKSIFTDYAAGTGAMDRL